MGADWCTSSLWMHGCQARAVRLPVGWRDARRYAVDGALSGYVGAGSHETVLRTKGLQWPPPLRRTTFYRCPLAVVAEQHAARPVASVHTVPRPSTIMPTQNGAHTERLPASVGLPVPAGATAPARTTVATPVVPERILSSALQAFDRVKACLWPPLHHRRRSQGPQRVTRSACVGWLCLRERR